MNPSENCETSEQVLFELDLMNLEDLRLMAWQNDLSTEGERISLISRIKESFGFESSTATNEDDKQRSSSASIMSSLSTPSSATAAATGAGSLPQFGENWSNLKIPDEDQDVGLESLKNVSQPKRKEPLLDLNLEAGEGSGKVSVLRSFLRQWSSHKTCSCHLGFSSMGRNDKSTLFLMLHIQFSGT